MSNRGHVRQWFQRRHGRKRGNQRRHVTWHVCIWSNTRIANLKETVETFFRTEFLENGTKLFKKRQVICTVIFVIVIMLRAVIVVQSHTHGKLKIVVLNHDTKCFRIVGALIIGWLCESTWTDCCNCIVSRREAWYRRSRIKPKLERSSLHDVSQHARENLSFGILFSTGKHASKVVRVREVNIGTRVKKL